MGVDPLRDWRMRHGITFAVCVIVMVLSVLMTPSTGFLHLGPLEIPEMCTFRRFLGVECPGCGLTRSFVFMAHLRPVDAFLMNKLGPPLFLLAAAQIPYRLYHLYRVWPGDDSGQAEPPVAG